MSKRQACSETDDHKITNDKCANTSLDKLSNVEVCVDLVKKPKFTTVKVSETVMHHPINSLDSETKDEEESEDITVRSYDHDETGQVEEKKPMPAHTISTGVKVDWTQIRKENLDVDHTILYSRREAYAILARCEKELSYNEGDLAKIQMFGKWINIPRKQVAHGDEGLTYTFSGNTIPARPWTPLLNEIREHVARVTGYSYNFVLINRYKDGADYMGEHKDDEKDLCPGHPIASLTLGQSRDFVFKHQDRKSGKRPIETVTVQLKHGMLLLMKDPTNSFWYHSLPKRAGALGVRINMTFRKMQRSKCKPVRSCKKVGKSVT
ncbi:DNA oxidative demethylase ALKBH2 [Aplysia californica]|uniref:DNA oxidative demethylase ALKBH2 n=1 Tax=Aplysia californica TaxID=6500 RepID=A0ABM0JZC4_APLCA|nr:DNA oxidative demethylase ALKBH2 [Aplysia californica]